MTTKALEYSQVATVMPDQGWHGRASRTAGEHQHVEAVISQWWESAGVPLLSVENRPFQSLQPVEHESVENMLTDRVRETLERLYPELELAARRSFIQVSKLEVSGFIDQDDDSEEVVVTQLVNAPAYAALSYWDKLGLILETWIKSLPDELKYIANRRIAIEVQWQRA